MSTNLSENESDHGSINSRYNDDPDHHQKKRRLNNDEDDDDENNESINKSEEATDIAGDIVNEEWSPSNEDATHSDSNSHENVTIDNITTNGESAPVLGTEYSQEDNNQDEIEQAGTYSDSSIEVIQERDVRGAHDDFDLNQVFDRSESSANGMELSNNNANPILINTQAIQSLADDNINEDVNNGNENFSDDNREIRSDANENNDAIEITSSRNLNQTTIDLEAAEQQVVEIPDEELENEMTDKEVPSKYKAARDYQCPICFDPPEAALITLCGHVFCCDCLFQMVNSSRTNRSAGHCALCRSNVRFRDVKLVILRKKRIAKPT